MSRNRRIGAYPVIGIRPTIDGRRGYLKVRESLEEQTWSMAKAAATLFRENLRYANGEPVQVVLADTTIGGVAEAAACQDKFRREGVDITLTVTPCWCYGAETMDMDPKTIKAVWGFNGTERPGAVYLASVLATHAQKGLPAFGIYGHEVQPASARQGEASAIWEKCSSSGIYAWNFLFADWICDNGNWWLHHRCCIFGRVSRYAYGICGRSRTDPPHGRRNLR